MLKILLNRLSYNIPHPSLLIFFWKLYTGAYIFLLVETNKWGIVENLYAQIILKKTVNFTEKSINYLLKKLIIQR